MWWWKAFKDSLGTDVSGTLARCVELRTPTVLLTYSPRRVYDARFAALRSDAVGVELFDAHPGDLPIGTLCCVSFNLSGRAGVFLTTLETIEHGAGHRPFVTLKMPEELTLVDARQSYRVPVSDTIDLTTVVTLDGKSWAARTVDVSAGGIKIDFALIPSEIDVGKRVGIRMVLGTDTGRLARAFECEGFLVRKEGPVFGVAFAEVTETEALDALIGQLEAEWIEARQAEG